MSLPALSLQGYPSFIGEINESTTFKDNYSNNSIFQNTYFPNYGFQQNNFFNFDSSGLLAMILPFIFGSFRPPFYPDGPGNPPLPPLPVGPYPEPPPVDNGPVEYLNDFEAVADNAVSGSVNINGSGQRLLVEDTDGANNHSVFGSDNRVEFVGDQDANSFHIGGESNEVSIYNVGGDDNIYLAGCAHQWEEVCLPESEQSRDSSHSLTYHNTETNTYVKVASDRDNRGEDWIRGRVSFD